jgi:hypothetical protein
MKIGFLVTVAGEDDPKYVADEIQAHLESLGFRHVDVEIRTQHHVDNTES